MLIDSFHIPALECHLPDRYVVLDPGQGRRHLHQGHMNLSFHQTEDETRMTYLTVGEY